MITDSLTPTRTSHGQTTNEVLDELKSLLKKHNVPFTSALQEAVEICFSWFDGVSRKAFDEVSYFSHYSQSAEILIKYGSTCTDISNILAGLYMNGTVNHRREKIHDKKIVEKRNKYFQKYPHIKTYTVQYPEDALGIDLGPDDLNETKMRRQQMKMNKLKTETQKTLLVVLSEKIEYLSFDLSLIERYDLETYLTEINTKPEYRYSYYSAVHNILSGRLRDAKIPDFKVKEMLEHNSRVIEKAERMFYPVNTP